MLSLAIPFPEIDPIIFSIGPFAIRWYALAYICGLLLGWKYISLCLQNGSLWPVLHKAGKKQPDVPAKVAQLEDFIVWATLGVVLGGRLGYVLFYNPTIIFSDPLAVFAIWQGGMSFHGGLIGVAVAVFVFSKRHKLDVLRMWDLVGATTPIGLFFGRIANFINSELWGNVTDAPWGVVFPNGGPLPRHPSQLYEAALEGLLLFIVLRYATHKLESFKYPGRTIGIFLMGYGLSRVIVEFFRQPDAHIGYLASFLTMGMLLSVPMILLGAALIWRSTGNAPDWLYPDNTLSGSKK